MAEVSFSPRAYCKILLHAAKYPHCAINGLLLAKQRGKGDNKSHELLIEDAIPLFHVCLHVSPMSEVALTLVDQVAAKKGLVIAGYYMANENLNDLSIDRPAHRIADKIAESFNGAVMVVLDNKEIGEVVSDSLFRVSQNMDGKWRPKDKATIMVKDEESVSQTLVCLFRLEKYKNIIDFDNHLDDITLDWQNPKLNNDIQELIDLCH